MASIISILLTFSEKIGYWGIILLMTIESSFIPFPSEVIIPPAAYLAQQGKMNIYLVILSGIIGSLLGAIINYFLSLTLGRKVIYILVKTRIARLLLINEDKIKKAETCFLHYGNLSTFFGRLVPALRQLISIPAGFSKMNFGAFIIFTLLGSGLWTVILAILGYVLGANQEILQKYYQIISLMIVVCTVLAILILVIRAFVRRKKKLGD